METTFPSQTPNSNRKKVFAIILPIAVGLVVFGGLIFYYLNSKNAEIPKEPQAVSLAQSLKPGEIKILNNTEIPEQFPNEFIVEPDAKILQNYNSMSSDGNLLAAREYVSEQTVDKNASLFLEMLNKGGWTIVDNIKKSGQVFLTADKAGSRLRLVIKPYLSTGKAQVLISNLEK
jgi:hypothetical protein